MKNVKIFNKLVRDRIPEKVKKNNEIPLTKKLNIKQFKLALIDKLFEECEEFKNDPSAEELADILEVLKSLAKAFKIHSKEIKKKQSKKLKERGGFTKQLLLIKTYSK
jgi:predicted house-cleaning noncanonical NTP pyrophosphatase (MazG superfamily)